MFLLATVFQTSQPIPISFPTIDVPAILLRLVLLLPLVGGYLLAREGRGNLLWEVLAVALLVLATVIPVTITSDSFTTILTAWLDRWPVMVFLIGLAFVRDGGFKIIMGVILMAVSGLILIPRP